MKASDNPYPSWLVVEGTAPASPGAGNQRLYIDSADHKLKRKNSGGTVTTIEAGAGAIGSSSLVYRYTVTGSAKASIDTGVDTADAGSNDWTNGDLLEVYFYARSDKAVIGDTMNWTLNNDTGSNYDLERLQALVSAISSAPSYAAANWALDCTGDSAAASIFGETSVRIHNFTGTTGYKNALVEQTLMNTSSGSGFPAVEQLGLTYRSTSAITRLKVAASASQNFKIGSQLLIYKRLAS